MKKLFLTSMLLSLLSCKDLDPTPKKPFLITGKNSTYYLKVKMAEYYYHDANGIRFSFTELNVKYNIGDTIK